jgi:hypothetical protein
MNATLNDPRTCLLISLRRMDFGDHVDNLRYDGTSKRLDVGMGTARPGQLELSTNKHVVEEFNLGAHPESFQLETSGPNICVNLPD